MINLQNYKKVVRLRNSGKSFSEIAVSLGLTRQRVWKMYTRIAEDPRLEPIKPLINLDKRRKILKDKADRERTIREKILVGLRDSIPGYVYLFGSTSLGFFKIGKTTKHPDFRQRCIDYCVPFKMDFCLYFSSIECNRDERRLHIKLKKYFLKNEWFNLPKDILAEVIQYFEERQ